MSILVVGSVFIDSLETPHGKVERTLGGAAIEVVGRLQRLRTGQHDRIDGRPVLVVRLDAAQRLFDQRAARHTPAPQRVLDLSDRRLLHAEWRRLLSEHGREAGNDWTNDGKLLHARHSMTLSMHPLRRCERARQLTQLGIVQIRDRPERHATLCPVFDVEPPER